MKDKKRLCWQLLLVAVAIIICLHLFPSSICGKLRHHPLSLKKPFLSSQTLPPALTEWGGEEGSHSERGRGRGRRKEPTEAFFSVRCTYLFIYLFWGQRLKFEGGQGETGGATVQCWRWRQPVIDWQMKRKGVWPPLTRGFDSETVTLSLSLSLNEIEVKKVSTCVIHPFSAVQNYILSMSTLFTKFCLF